MNRTPMLFDSIARIFGDKDADIKKPSKKMVVPLLSVVTGVKSISNH